MGRGGHLQEGAACGVDAACGVGVACRETEIILIRVNIQHVVCKAQTDNDFSRHHVTLR